METLFNIAGFALILNVLCSLFLFAKLHNEPLSAELFALPNAWLGPRPRWLSLRLLRAKFFLPWVPSPPAMSEYSISTRATFFLARASGVAFPLAIFAFLVGVFVFASH
jgi:hypothetical protein